VLQGQKRSPANYFKERPGPLCFSNKELIDLTPFDF